jgi:hypothetical protein
MHTGQAQARTSGSAGVRVALGMLLGFGAINAFGGAYYGLAGAQGVPREWLEGSPFSDYTIPSIVLGAVVGGSLLLAALAVFRRWLDARLFATGAGVILLGWIAVQVAIIGYVSWMQPVTAAWGVAILLGARVLGSRRQRAEEDA